MRAKDAELRLVAIFLIFRDTPFVRAAYEAIYPVVDEIVAVTAYDRTYSGEHVAPDDTIATLLGLDDPNDKLRLLVSREHDKAFFRTTESRLRHAAMRVAPDADYYLIVDADEIHETPRLRACWEFVRRHRGTAYRMNSHTYFKKWNWRVEPPYPHKHIVFVNRNCRFRHLRKLRITRRHFLKELLTRGHKARIEILPDEFFFHHGSYVGDDERIRGKITNYGHKEEVHKEWFENVWCRFTPDMHDFHPFEEGATRFERIVTIPTSDLPPAIRDQLWPLGWIEPLMG